MKKDKGNIITFKRTIGNKTTVIYFIEEGWKRIWYNDYTNPIIGFFKHLKTKLCYIQLGYTVYEPYSLEKSYGTHKRYIEEQFARHDKAQEIFEKIK